MKRSSAREIEQDVDSGDETTGVRIKLNSSELVTPVPSEDKPWYQVDLCQVSDEDLVRLHCIACGRERMPSPYCNKATEMKRRILAENIRRHGHGTLPTSLPLSWMRPKR